MISAQGKTDNIVFYLSVRT